MRDNRKDSMSTHAIFRNFWIFTDTARDKMKNTALFSTFAELRFPCTFIVTAGAIRARPDSKISSAPDTKKGLTPGHTKPPSGLALESLAFSRSALR
jgi:hypothetical protein